MIVDLSTGYEPQISLLAGESRIILPGGSVSQIQLDNVTWTSSQLFDFVNVTGLRGVDVFNFAGAAQVDGTAFDNRLSGYGADERLVGLGGADDLGGSWATTHLGAARDMTVLRAAWATIPISLRPGSAMM